MSEDTSSTIAVKPPTEPGFYKYDGGAQSILFRLDQDGQWHAIFGNRGESPCDWGYVEQALGVYKLVKIDFDQPKVVMELPVFLPGNNRNWEHVDGNARIESDGTITVRLKRPEMSEELVEMCERNVLLQVAFDYRMGLDEMGKINNQFQMEYADDDTLFKAYNAICASQSPSMDSELAASVLWCLQQAGIVLKEVK